MRGRFKDGLGNLTGPGHKARRQPCRDRSQCKGTNTRTSPAIPGHRGGCAAGQALAGRTPLRSDVSEHKEGGQVHCLGPLRGTGIAGTSEAEERHALTCVLQGSLWLEGGKAEQLPCSQWFCRGSKPRGVHLGGLRTVNTVKTTLTFGHRTEEYRIP